MKRATEQLTVGVFCVAITFRNGKTHWWVIHGFTHAFFLRASVKLYVLLYALVLLEIQIKILSKRFLKF